MSPVLWIILVGALFYLLIDISESLKKIIKHLDRAEALSERSDDALSSISGDISSLLRCERNRNKPYTD